MSNNGGQQDTLPAASDRDDTTESPVKSKASKRALVGTGLGVGSAAIAAALLFAHRAKR